MPPGPAQPSILRRSVSRDVGAHAASLTHWDQTYDQLHRGRFEGCLDEIWLGDLQLFRERTSVSILESGSAWPNSRTFGVPLAMDGPGLFAGCALDVDSMLTLGPRDTLDFRTPPGLDIVGIALDAAAFGAHTRTLEAQDWEATLAGRRVIAAPASALAPLRSLLREVFTTAERAPARLARTTVRVGLRDQILERLVGVLAASLPDPGASFTVRVRRDIVARARAFAAAHPDQPLTVSELCEALRVSRRTLQNCFQEVLAISPHQYLQALRLNGLRRALRDPAGPGSVQEAATRWGFWHLSACAAEYKRMFGELPSATLRARGRAACGA